ncbi:MAG: hypothetical protein ABIU85_09565 [Methylotenera sp.]
MPPVGAQTVWRPSAGDARAVRRAAAQSLPAHRRQARAAHSPDRAAGTGLATRALCGLALRKRTRSQLQQATRSLPPALHLDPPSVATRAKKYCSSG